MKGAQTVLIVLLTALTLSGCLNSGGAGDDVNSLPGQPGNPTGPVDDSFPLPWTWTNDTQVAVLFTINGTSADSCTISIHSRASSARDEPLGLGIIRRPGNAGDYAWRYVGNAAPAMAHSVPVDSREILGESHEGAIDWTFQIGMGEKVELLWIGLNLDLRGGEPAVEVKQDCTPGVLESFGWSNQVCLADEGQLDGYAGAGAGYSRIVAQTGTWCTINGTGETGLVLTGGAQGEGWLSTPSESLQFTASLNQADYFHLAGGSGDFQWTVAEMVSVDLGAIWYAVATPTNLWSASP